jgi:hypothetical protein
MYMLMAKYSAAAMKGIVETGSDREAAARAAIEAAGGNTPPGFESAAADCRYERADILGVTG